MIRILFSIVVLISYCSQGQGIVSTYESDLEVLPAAPIDKLLVEGLAERGLEPARICTDAVFVRRVYLDVTGTLPTAAEAQNFLEDEDPAKRSLLIDDLLARETHVLYWTQKWCDLLRVKAEFPINLWPNAVQAYHRWIFEAVRENRRWDEVARALLTSSGSNFRDPPVNFYRAVQGKEPGDLARAAALTFMGTRLESWPAERQAELALFFSRVAYKGTAEWKEEIVYLDPEPVGEQTGVLPDGTRVRLGPDEDPRQVFADWLVDPANPWFARNLANRTWYWLMGRGLIQEPDDIRPDNPPVHPKLLTYLEQELVRAEYDLQHIMREILNSHTYQQSSVARTDHPDPEALFLCYPVRPLDAEVLIDALCQLTGTTETYVSEIPEPFTHVPESQRSIALSDGSISSPFLEMFGRPARDTGLASERSLLPTDAQRMHLLNSSHIQRKIEQGPGVRAVLQEAKWNSPRVVRSLYFHILSRPPTPFEYKTALAHVDIKGNQKKQRIDDLAWALINSKEFLYRH